MHVRIRRICLALAATVLVVATACNNGDVPDPADPAPTPPPGVPESPEVTAPVPEGMTVPVGLVDFELDLAETTFAPGTYTFVAEQQGAEPHALAISGPGVDETTSILQEAGESEELTVTLEAGTYELWCPVGNHRELGMETTIEVS